MAKKLINGDNRDAVFPIVHPWAVQAHKDMLANHWTAQEINMPKDISDIKQGKLSTQQLNQLQQVLAFFLNSDGIVGRSLLDVLARHTTSAEFRKSLNTQNFYEMIHQDAYEIMFDLCTPDEDKPRVLALAENDPVIKAKNSFADKYIHQLDNASFKLDTIENIKNYAVALFIFSVIVEGAFFYTGFGQVLCLKVIKLLKGCHENVEYIARDESLHRANGINALITLRDENPEIWDNDLISRFYKLANEGMAIEDAYIDQSVAKDILGFNPRYAKSYAREAMNSQMIKLGIHPLFEVEYSNALPWLDEIIFTNKEKNFFETRVTEYQSSSGLNWEDDEEVIICPLNRNDGKNARVANN